MTKNITSINNSFIQHIKSLKDKKYRDKLNEFYIEGYRIIKDALENGADIKAVLFDENIQNEEFQQIRYALEQRGISIYSTAEKIFKLISDTETPQGILAVISKNNITIDEIEYKTDSLLVILENVQDPGNLGTIIRTADASGADAIIVSKGCVDIYNPKVLRSTMGSIFHLPIVKVDHLNSFIDTLIENKFNVYAAHLSGKKAHFDADMISKSAVIIGNEANGITDEVSGRCTLIKIPMLGKSESLNASVSAAVILYECLRQRMTKS